MCTVSYASSQREIVFVQHGLLPLIHLINIFADIVKTAYMEVQWQLLVSWITAETGCRSLSNWWKLWWLWFHVIYSKFFFDRSDLYCQSPITEEFWSSKKRNITQVLTSVYHGLCFLNTKYLQFYVYAVVKMVQFISYHCHIDSNFLPPFLPPSFPLEHGCCDSWWRRRYMLPSGMFSVLHDLLYASCQKCIYWKPFLQSNEYISRYAFT